jgi:2-iminoacetate synthase ThiH
MTPLAIERLIVAAGRQPIERDTFYNVIRPAGLKSDA